VVDYDLRAPMSLVMVRIECFDVVVMMMMISKSDDMYLAETADCDLAP